MQNLEAKFRLADLQRAQEQAERIGYRFKATLIQRDTFFRVPQGKLKLREEESSGAWIIFYGRQASGDLKLSNYDILPVTEPEKFREVMTRALGTIAVVKKTRILMMRDHIRLHLDSVENLGVFGEIEAVLGEPSDAEGSRPAVEELLDTLGVDANHLIGESYFELMLKAGAIK